MMNKILTNGGARCIISNLVIKSNSNYLLAPENCLYIE